MLDAAPSREMCLARLALNLSSERYSQGVAETYPGAVKRFLDFLDKNDLTVISVQPSDVKRYVDSLQMVKKRRGRATGELRKIHRAAIHMLLRLFHDRWPPTVAPATEQEIEQHQILEDYAAWMHEIRGLAAVTEHNNKKAARRFLTWLGQRKTSVSAMHVADLDAYVQASSTSICRTSMASLVGKLRNFLRFLSFSARASRDLSSIVSEPRIYDFEQIPFAMKAEDIKQILQCSRQTRSSIGRRDYAMLLMLVTYGLRGGELVSLRLEDIDWRNEVLRVRHSKTNTYTELPLLKAPAAALLNYLRHGRPETPLREVFIRAAAPYRPFTCSGGLHHTIQRYLSATGKLSVGRKGAHALRHARAISLLRAEVPLKTIGDVLGHRSARSTMVYLKLATEDLRAVALDLPRSIQR